MHASPAHDGAETDHVLYGAETDHGLPHGTVRIDSAGAVCAFIRSGPASRHDNSAGGGGGALADFFREQWSVREYNIIPYDRTVQFQGKGVRERR